MKYKYDVGILSFFSQFFLLGCWKVLALLVYRFSYYSSGSAIKAPRRIVETTTNSASSRWKSLALDLDPFACEDSYRTLLRRVVHAPAIQSHASVNFHDTEDRNFFIISSASWSNCVHCYRAKLILLVIFLNDPAIVIAS